MDLRPNRIEVGPAMFAGDQPFGFQTLQILTDGRLGHHKGLRQIADAGSTFFLNPFQNAAAARFGQKARKAVVCPITAHCRFAPASWDESTLK